DDGIGHGQGRGRGRGHPAGRELAGRARHRHGQVGAAVTMQGIVDKAAIAGIGATEFSKDSGRSELRLAVEAVGAAIDDAGLQPPAQWVAMFATRIMHEHGVTSEHFGRVAVADRKHAATNPKAWFYEQPITLEDHQKSRWIVEPLHLLDCCQESDGAQALVVTSVERAADLRQPPVVIRAAAQGAGDEQDMMTSYYRDSITGLPEMGLVADQLWATAGLTATDIQTAVIYD